ncbi:hypothetical protein Tco_1384412 [Tanacetum coccineum]
MSDLKFVDTHNLVAFLKKPTESEGFEEMQILDFLIANPIKYALTVNPTIYTTYGKKVIITKTSVRRDIQLEEAEGIECLPNADIFKQLALMGIGKGFSGAVTPLFLTMMVQAQEEMGEEPIVDEAANEENVPTQSNDPSLSRVNTLRSGEDKLKLKELMDLYTKLSDRFLDLKTTKTAQVKEIASLKKRWRYDDAQMFDTNVFNGEEVFVTEQSEKVVEEVVSTAKVSDAATITTEEITLAQALAELRKEEQARLAREKVEKVEEANILWDNVQAMIEADRLLAEILQAREQEELTNEEKARLFVELLEKRKKHFAALRAQEKKNKPPTKAQKKSTMSTYLKNMAGYKQSQLKNKSFVEIQKLFDNAMTRVNMFVDKDTELVKEISKKAEAEMAQESSSKRAGEELEQEVAKKQKMEDDKEKEDLKQCFEIVQDDEVVINATPLATKPAPIVNFQIHRKGRNDYSEIMKADGSAKTYLLFSQLLKEFDREDLENLWKLVKSKHGNTRPEEGYERVLWGDLKTMFEHHVEDLNKENLHRKEKLLLEAI